jgi:hypothetical protein
VQQYNLTKADQFGIRSSGKESQDGNDYKEKSELQKKSLDEILNKIRTCIGNLSNELLAELKQDFVNISDKSNGVDNLQLKKIIIDIHNNHKLKFSKENNLFLYFFKNNKNSDLDIKIDDEAEINDEIILTDLFRSVSGLLIKSVSNSSDQPTDSNNGSKERRSYEKNNLTGAGVSGFSYQAKIIMLYAFDAYINGKNFQLMTEAKGYEKFDDLIIFYEDRILVLQAKYCYTEINNTYTLQMLTNPDNDRKKAGLPIYFDAWKRIEAERAKNPKEFIGKPIQYVFYTNHKLDTSNGLDKLYSSKDECFSEEFIFGTSLESEQKKIRSAIIESIRQHSVELRKEENRSKSYLQNFTVDFSNHKEEIDKIIKETAEWFKKELNKSSSIIIKKDDLPSLMKKEKNKEKLYRKYMLILLKALFVDSNHKASHHQRKVYKLKDNFIENSASLKSYQKQFFNHLNLTESDLKKIKIETSEINLELNIQNSFITMESISIISGAAVWKVPQGCLIEALVAVVEESNSDLNNEKHPLSSFKSHIENILLKHPGLKIEELDEDAEMPSDIKKFFEQLTLRLEQPDEVALTKELEKKIRNKFFIEDRSFYLRFYEYMLDELKKRQGEVITERNVEALFNLARIELKRQHLTGHTDRFMHHLQYKTSYKLPLFDSIWLEIDNFISNSDKRVLLIHCKNPYAGAMSICQFFEERQIIKGEYSFIDANYAILKNDPSVFQSEPFKIMAIDQADILSEEHLKEFIKKTVDSNKKLILICQTDTHVKVENYIKENGYIGIYENIENVTFDLSKEQIETILKECNAFDKCARLGLNHVKLANALSMPHSGLYIAMRDPLLLKEIISVAVTYDDKVENVSTIVKDKKEIFISQVIQSQFPTYKWDDLIRTNSSFHITIDEQRFGECFEDKIIKIDLIELEKLSLENVYTIKELIELSHGEQETSDYQNKFLFLLNAKNFYKLSENIRQHLLQCKRCLLLNNKEYSNTFNCINLETIETNDEVIFKLFDLHDFHKMTSVKKYMIGKNYNEQDYKQFLDRQPHGQKRVLVSSYGSGKSKLLIELEKHFTSMFPNIPNNTYSMVFIIPFKKLDIVSSDLNVGSLPKYLYRLIKKHYNLSELLNYEKFCLNYDIEHENILLLLDGWDEIKETQRQTHAVVLKYLFNYSHIIVTSRPSDEAFIPINAMEHLRLFNFNDQQIQKFINEYFSNDSFSLQKANTLINKYKDKKRLFLLGKPLLCRIICETLDNIGYINEEKLFISTLFNKFIETTLRKYHHIHNRIPHQRLTVERIYNLSQIELERMRRVAFYHMFNIKTDIEPNETLDRDLLDIAIMRPTKQLPITIIDGYEFDHQTIAEYFSAIHLVHLMQSKEESIIKLIKENLYIPRYQLVWHFISSIVTVGDTMLPQARKICFTFFDVLFNAPEDLVGLTQQSLLANCLMNTDFSVLEKSIEKLQVSPDIKEKYINFFQRYRWSDAIQMDIDEEEYTKGVNKIISPEVIDEKDDEIERSCRYTRGILQKPYSNKKHDQNDLDSLVDLFLRKQSMNESEYQAAYHGICELLDQGIINLDENLAEKLTTNFDQKACVCDLIIRLKKANLLTDRMIEKLCKFNRDNRREFWDFNAGIPVMVYLKDRLNANMAIFLVNNILQRNRGDFEINAAYEVLIRLSSMNYVAPIHINVFLEEILYKLASYNDKNDSNIRTIYENVIIHFSREQLIKSAWVNYCSFVSFFYKEDCKRKSFYLKLLFDIAINYKLAVVMVNHELRWNSDVIDPLKIPENKKEKQFILYSFNLLKKRNDYDMQQLINGTMKEFYPYLKSISEFNNNQHDNCEEVFSMERCMTAIEEQNSDFLQHDLLEYRHKFGLQNLQNLFYSLIKILKKHNENDLLFFLKFLLDFKLPDLEYLFCMKEEDLEFFETKLCSASKENVTCYIAFLSIVQCTESILGNFFKNKIFAKSFWDIDAYIPAVGFLSNYFNKEAYNYLLTAANHTWYCTQETLEKTINMLSESKLSNKHAINYFIKMLLQFNNDKLFDNCVENIKVNFNLSILQDICKTLKETEYTDNARLEKLLVFTDCNDYMEDDTNIIEEHFLEYDSSNAVVPKPRKIPRLSL